jgi:GNAT superfamily N-acetyltransferase
MGDLNAIKELIATSEIAKYGVGDSTLEDLVSNWHQPDFNLSQDAWVIVTNKGQLVGFACVWHKDYEQISTYVCVHHEYRGRGIGTLLLRLVEERARQLVRNARPGTRVTLSGTVVSINNQAKRLFEREGYRPVRKYWRIAVRSNDLVEKTSQHHDVEVNLDIDSHCLVGASRLYDRDAIYIIREFDVFEKELRAGELLRMDANSELNMLVTLS